MSASRSACRVTGMVIVEATANTNSVTISEGIKLDAFLSNSFRIAPSRDYIKNILAMVHAVRQVLIYFSVRCPVVDFRFHATMKAQIQLILQVIHCITVDMHAGVVR